MPAPTNYPDWGTDETNNVEPPAGKIAEGWLPAEQPPSSWFNWWKNLVGLWVRWFDEVTTAHTADIAALQIVADDAALKSEQNTFAKTQIINVENAEPYLPLLTTTQKIADWVPNPANRWKRIIEIPTQGDAHASIYVGQFPDGAAMVNNARWDVGAAEWRQVDTAYPSTGMVGGNGQYRVSFVPAGTATGWADWPTDSGADFIASGNLLAGGVPPASGNVFAVGSFKYAPVQVHWIMLFPEGGWDTFQDRTRLSAGESQIFRMRLPYGATFGQVNVKIEQYTGCNYTIELHQTHSKGFSDTSDPGNVDTIHDSETVSGGGTGVVVNHNLNYPTLTADNEFDIYWVWVLCHVGSPADIDVFGAQIGFQDPGPRNH